uniref:Uncharacterized protein n=1 Tax=Arundo donax TaxID=35708 RepID=A0A0A9EJP9_ARUDO
MQAAKRSQAPLPSEVILNSVLCLISVTYLSSNHPRPKIQQKSLLTSCLSVPYPNFEGQ